MMLELLRISALLGHSELESTVRYLGIEVDDAHRVARCARSIGFFDASDAGCMWIAVYTAVTTQAGRYVQGGGCASVGVAGLVQGGGFGSFSLRL